ncbi:divalent-cation tolerance protein CutA [Streptomyces shenzhenensis]|uniref:divalent-cation tolerance protein CutA n=1 Tax=Streptomyces shenzhenensis TaxID=943815 RepID=UPI003D8FF594
MVGKIVVVQTTIDDEDKAIVLARGAVENHLAAGAHIDPPLTAVYWWKGRIETAREWRISYKTSADRLSELQTWVVQEHSYEVPEFVVLPIIGGTDAYLSWVAEESAVK